VAHVTRDSDTTYKVKGQGHQAALLTAVLARQAAAAVGVGTCWPWETAATLPFARRRKALRRPREERGGGISWRPPTYSLFCHILTSIPRSLLLDYFAKIDCSAIQHCHSNYPKYSQAAWVMMELFSL